MIQRYLRVEVIRTASIRAHGQRRFPRVFPIKTTSWICSCTRVGTGLTYLIRSGYSAPYHSMRLPVTATLTSKCTRPILLITGPHLSSPVMALMKDILSGRLMQQVTFLLRVMWCLLQNTVVPHFHYCRQEYGYIKMPS